MADLKEITTEEMLQDLGFMRGQASMSAFALSIGMTTYGRGEATGNVQARLDSALGVVAIIEAKLTERGVAVPEWPAYLHKGRYIP